MFIAEIASAPPDSQALAISEISTTLGDNLQIIGTLRATFFDVLTLTTFNFHHHRLTLKSHLNDPEIIAPTSERLRQVASSLGLSQKYLDGIKFLPDGRVDIDSC